MNKEIGNISFYDPQRSEYMDKPYSESTAKKIDQEVRKLVESAYTRTKNLLKDKQEELEIVAKELLDKEVIFQRDLEKLIGARPFDKPTYYTEYVNGNGKAEKEETTATATTTDTTTDSEAKGEAS